MRLITVHTSKCRKIPPCPHHASATKHELLPSIGIVLFQLDAESIWMFFFDSIYFRSVIFTIKVPNRSILRFPPYPQSSAHIPTKTAAEQPPIPTPGIAAYTDHRFFGPHGQNYETQVSNPHRFKNRECARCYGESFYQ